MIKVGLKNNALILFRAMKGDNLGGRSGGIFHSSIIFLSKVQFEKLKSLIEYYGYCPKKSLSEITIEPDLDYSCSLIK